MKETEEFLRKINDALSIVDQEFLLEHVSDDFCWTIIGERTLTGKPAFAEALKEMSQIPKMKIEVKNIISSEDNWGVVEGIVTGKNRFGQKKYFGFCDVYKFEDSNNNKIASMTSYVIDASRHKRYKEDC